MKLTLSSRDRAIKAYLGEKIPKNKRSISTFELQRFIKSLDEIIRSEHKYRNKYQELRKEYDSLISLYQYTLFELNNHKLKG